MVLGTMGPWKKWSIEKKGDCEKCRPIGGSSLSKYKCALASVSLCTCVPAFTLNALCLLITHEVVQTSYGPGLCVSFISSM